jgi:hypothetical protein
LVKVNSSQVAALQDRYAVVGAVRRTDGVELRLLGDPASLSGLSDLLPAAPTLEDAYILQMDRSLSLEVLHV